MLALGQDRTWHVRGLEDGVPSLFVMLQLNPRTVLSRFLSQEQAPLPIAMALSAARPGREGRGTRARPYPHADAAPRRRRTLLLSPLKRQRSICNSSVPNRISRRLQMSGCPLSRARCHSPRPSSCLPAVSESPWASCVPTTKPAGSVCSELLVPLGPAVLAGNYSSCGMRLQGETTMISGPRGQCWELPHSPVRPEPGSSPEAGGLSRC